jgi:glycosyltransferase involved in cell wall biosynthesis
VANSERTRKDLVERLGIDSEKIKTIYLGADVDRFGAVSEFERRQAREALGWNDERPAVLFVGAMGDHRKGFDTLYEAWKQLVAESSWDARLVVVGAGASLGSWQARAAAEGFAGSIEFLGFRKDVESVMAACDILVSPARYEAYGLNVHEALCRGLPALASRDSGVAEQFTESLTELLIPDPNDAGDLARRLKIWRSKPELLKDATSSVSERLRLRSWGVVAREFIEVMESG